MVHKTDTVKVVTISFNDSAGFYNFTHLTIYFLNEKNIYIKKFTGK